MHVRQLFDPSSSSFSYLISDEPTRQAALIDPVREHLERDLLLIRELKLDLRYVLETHVHADHVTSAAALAERTSAITCASALGAACAQRQLEHRDHIRLGATVLTALATPGHTPDSLSYYDAGGHVFTGDALLVRGTGRTDLQSGDAGALFDSITRQLFTLPEATVVWPGHDYRGHTQTTVNEERRLNPRLANTSRKAFIALMRELQLAPPRLLAVAVPANLACGRAVAP